MLLAVSKIRWRLREVMARKRVTATALAETLGVNRVTVSEWSRSDEVPSFRDAQKTLTDLCDALKCVPADLIVSEDGND